jgi:hypothetical protein
MHWGTRVTDTLSSRRQGSVTSRGCGVVQYGTVWDWFATRTTIMANVALHFLRSQLQHYCCCCCYIQLSIYRKPPDLRLSTIASLLALVWSVAAAIHQAAVQLRACHVRGLVERRHH